MKSSVLYLIACTALALSGCENSPAPSDSVISGALANKDNTGTVQVFITNSHTQCANNGVPLAQTQMILVQGGIDVLGSVCGVITGIAFPAVCGAATGEINIHRVRRENVVDAERLGFRSVSDIGTVPGVPGTGFQEVNCDTRLPIS